MGKKKTIAQLESELALRKAKQKIDTSRKEWEKLRDAHRNKRW